MEMQMLLKKGREQKGLTTREVSKRLKIDQALVSKFENGLRRPTKKQVLSLAALLEIDSDTLLILWLKEKILHEIKDETFGLKALEAVLAEFKPSENVPKESPIDQLFEEMEALKSKMENLRNSQQDK